MHAEAEDLRKQLDQLGPVNVLAIEEHDETVKRHDFLVAQRTDMSDARASLLQAIKEIDNTARGLFMETFKQIRENFRTIFFSLFGGGDCDLRLENPDAPLDCDIEIHASPRGKKTQRIHLLSSGERALVALSLLFGIFLTKPSPFCLLDEVDAPLDDANVGRFVRMLTQFKSRTQFIVITHNPRTTTEAGDAVYGVTMQEPGVSSLVSVRMRGPSVTADDEEAVVGAGAGRMSRLRHLLCRTRLPDQQSRWWCWHSRFPRWRVRRRRSPSTCPPPIRSRRHRPFTCRQPESTRPARINCASACRSTRASGSSSTTLRSTGWTSTFRTIKLLPENQSIFVEASVIDGSGKVVLTTSRLAGRTGPRLTLLSPDGSTNITVFTRQPRFSWRSAAVTTPPGPWVYELHVVNVATQETFIHSGIIDSSYTLPDSLQAQTSYRWSVVARLPNGLAADSGFASSLSSFVVFPTDEAPITLLYQNFPNPFPAPSSATTCIWFDLKTAGQCPAERAGHSRPQGEDHHSRPALRGPDRRPLWAATERRERLRSAEHLGRHR